MQFVGVGGAFIQYSGTIIGMSYWFNMRDKVRMGELLKEVASESEISFNVPRSVM